MLGLNTDKIIDLKMDLWLGLKMEKVDGLDERNDAGVV